MTEQTTTDLQQIIGDLAGMMKMREPWVLDDDGHPQVNEAEPDAIFPSLRRKCRCNDGWLYFDRGQTGFYMECYRCHADPKANKYRDDEGATPGKGWLPVNPEDVDLDALLDELPASGVFKLNGAGTHLEYEVWGDSDAEKVWCFHWIGEKDEEGLPKDEWAAGPTAKAATLRGVHEAVKVTVPCESE